MWSVYNSFVVINGSSFWTWPNKFLVSNYIYQSTRERQKEYTNLNLSNKQALTVIARQVIYASEIKNAKRRCTTCIDYWLEIQWITHTVDSGPVTNYRTRSTYQLNQQVHFGERFPYLEANSDGQNQMATGDGDEDACNSIGCRSWNTVGS
jgi:hypothetical protein